MEVERIPLITKDPPPHNQNFAFSKTALLLLLIITTSIIYFFLDGSGSKANTQNKSFRFVQIKSSNNFFLRIDSTKNIVTATEMYPWLHGSTFKLELNTNECFSLLTIGGHWLSVGNDRIIFASTIRNKSNLCLAPRKSRDAVNLVYFQNWDSSWLSFKNNEEQPVLVATFDKTNKQIYELITIPEVRGVNLGGWFIPEVWMTPSFFSGSGLGWGGSLCGMVERFNKSLTEIRMQEHLKLWITEDDFDMMSAIGINSIRLPIGYWNIMRDPYGIYAPADHQLSLRYIDWCFDMAESRGISVLLDIHGAPGSQNGMDHSGCSTPVGWQAMQNVEITLQAVEAAVIRYGNRTNLFGIELLNEPGFFLEKDHHAILLDYYQRAYSLVRSHHKELYVIFNELYVDYYHSWNNSLQEPDYYNVIMDLHLYDWQEPYTPENAHQHVMDAEQWGPLIQSLSSRFPVLVGEWCMSSGTFVQAGQAFVNASLASFDNAFGSYVWNWKIESGIGFNEWNLKYQFESGGLHFIN